MNKKKVLGIIGAVVGIAAVCDVVIEKACDIHEKIESQKPAKYVFLFIGDGMGWTNVSVAESYLAYTDSLMGGPQLTFTQFPVYGSSWTYSNNERVTDSAAGGTAIATGKKTDNGHIGTAPDGSPIKSIAYDLHEKGYNIGIMSNVPVNHATPASFYGQTFDRNEYRTITKQIAQTGFEFFGGDGFIDFDNVEEGVNSDEYLESKNYAVAYGPTEFKNRLAEGKNMVFAQAHCRKNEDTGFNADTDKTKEYKIEKDPDRVSLGEMMQLCLDKIGDKKPFFIMCEGGDIDWASHSNQTMAMIRDFEDMDSAVKLAYEFYQKHPDETLIIVTADHETGTPTVGYKYHLDWAKFEEAEKSGEKLDKEANKELNRSGVAWASGNHSGNVVPVFAVGKGAEKFAGVMENTDIKGKILCEE